MVYAKIHVFGCNYRAKSTDHDKLTASKLTAKRRFCYSDFVTNFDAVILSQSEGFVQDGSGDSKNIFRIALFSQSTLFMVSLLAVSWFAVSCCGPVIIAIVTLTMMLISVTVVSQMHFHRKYLGN